MACVATADNPTAAAIRTEAINLFIRSLPERTPSSPPRNVIGVSYRSQSIVRAIRQKSCKSCVNWVPHFRCPLWVTSKIKASPPQTKNAPRNDSWGRRGRNVKEFESLHLKSLAECKRLISEVRHIPARHFGSFAPSWLRPTLALSATARLRTGLRQVNPAPLTGHRPSRGRATVLSGYSPQVRSDCPLSANSGHQPAPFIPL
jgi:hypothetical protein